ncbi:type III-B CRISPR module RAMP protein Cmr4 [Peptococcaceae bacterium]|nr:type III-B CRISPR module RAMP protein Cmr4 [Peptococcaceae bacterium]
MFKIAKPFFMLCETPLHAGSGDDLGVVDRPIQRERHTDFPKVESSSLKGALREIFEKMESIILNGKKINDSKELRKAVELVFGPESGDKHAGALGFTDARLLLFPVKSVKGVFAWVTCPHILNRFKNDLSLCGVKNNFSILKSIPATPGGCTLFVKDKKIVLEEYTFEITSQNDENCKKLAEWLAENALPSDDAYTYWRDKIKRDIVILSDDDFRDFVSMCTEVITRIKINSETGTVQTRALFIEEYLPAESILYSLALTSPVRNKEKSIFAANTDKISEGEKEMQEAQNIMNYFTENIKENSVFQLGGNAGIGKGFVHIKVLS